MGTWTRCSKVFFPIMKPVCESHPARFARKLTSWWGGNHRRIQGLSGKLSGLSYLGTADICDGETYRLCSHSCSLSLTQAGTKFHRRALMWVLNKQKCNWECLCNGDLLAVLEDMHIRIRAAINWCVHAWLEYSLSFDESRHYRWFWLNSSC